MLEIYVKISVKPYNSFRGDSFELHRRQYCYIMNVIDRMRAPFGSSSPLGARTKPLHPKG